MDNLNDQINQQKQVLQSNPNDFNANFSLGKMLYDAGQDQFNQASSLKSANEPESNQISESGKKLTQDAMPYMEKAFEIKPDDKEVHSKLQSIYSTLGLDDKIKGINERIDDTQ